MSLSLRVLFPFLFTLALPSFVVSFLPAAPLNCQALSGTQKRSLITYVQEKYKIPETVSLRLITEETIVDSCARKLTFEGTGSVGTWSLPLYLSSDLRFRTDKLYDTTVDPVKEEQLNAERLNAALTTGAVPTLGPRDAQVTIVEFSDFQCPFCRRFEQIQKEVLAKGSGQVRVVFHYLPLSMHQWARPAALGAACARLQSNEAFWTLHDKLFENQAIITPENVASKLVEFVGQAKTIDLKAFQNCLDNEMSLGLVLRDINLASSNQVTATPTLFINGHRVQGVKDSADLSRLIEEAKAEAKTAVLTSSVSSPVTRR